MNISYVIYVECELIRFKHLKIIDKRPAIIHITVKQIIIIIHYPYAPYFFYF